MVNIKSKAGPAVIIIGAGLGGLALALCLHKHKIRSTILELRNRDSEDGGFLALAPNALHVLKQIGVFDQIAEEGFSYEELFFLSARTSSVLGTIYNGNREKYGFPAIRVSRHAVRRILLERVESLAINVRFNTKVVEVEEIDKKVIIKLAGNSIEEADFVIGADGIHSRIRRHVVAGVEPEFTGQMGLSGGQLPRSLLESSGKLAPMPALFIGKTNSFMMMPTNKEGSMISCFATVEESDRTREEWAEFANERDALARMLRERHTNGHWPAVVSQACQEAKPSSLVIWPFYHVPELENWSTQTGRVILIGDAAHAMPPTGGQGAAMAFEDAISLASVLMHFQDEERSFKRQLGVWEERRRQRVSKVLAFTNKSGNLRRSTPSDFQQMIKEFAMKIYFWGQGKDGGLQWVYSYKADQFEAVTSA